MVVLLTISMTTLHSMASLRLGKAGLVERVPLLLPLLPLLHPSSSVRCRAR
jgi:hypothetical protein